MKIAFFLRTPDGDRSERILCVPIAYAWQEGPDDLHVYFKKDGDGFNPTMAEGDYLVPDPDGGAEPVLCYKIGFYPSETPSCIEDLLVKAGSGYIAKLEALWFSPNR